MKRDMKFGTWNVKLDFLEVGCRGMDWIDLTQNRDRWQVLVNAAMILWVP
jgi:hypothetical protein